MNCADRMQGALVVLAAAAGLMLGLSLPQVGMAVEHLVLPALLVMLVAIFVQLNISSVAQVRHSKGLIGASLLLNFAFTPALAWLLGAWFLGDQPDLRIGLLLLLVTPCTDWYLVFTAMARGHTGVAAALLPVNLLIQVLLLPLYVLLLGGEAAMVGFDTLASAVGLVVGLPLLTAVLLRRFSPPGIKRALLQVSEAAVLPLLCVAVASIFAWQATTVLDHGAYLLVLLVPLLVFFVVLPAVATLGSLLLRLSAAQRVTLTMATTARNSPIALAIAVTAFPDRPLIAVALVLGPLIELPVLAILSQLVRNRSPEPPETVPTRGGG